MNITVRCLWESYKFHIRLLLFNKKFTSLYISSYMNLISLIWQLTYIIQIWPTYSNIECGRHIGPDVRSILLGDILAILGWKWINNKTLPLQSRSNSGSGYYRKQIQEILEVEVYIWETKGSERYVNVYTLQFCSSFTQCEIGLLDLCYLFKTCLHVKIRFVWN